MTMLSVQSIPPSLGRAHWKSWSGFWSGTSRLRTSPDQAIATIALPPAMSSTYELPVTCRTMPDLTAVSTAARASSNCACVSVAGSYPSLIADRPTVSRISDRYVNLPLNWSVKNTSIESRAPVLFLSKPIPVMPDCHGAARFVSGSNDRPL